MAGEENMTTAAIPATSVPQIDGLQGALLADNGPQQIIRANLHPYEAATNWRPWPAVGMVVLITIVSMAIALVGSLLLMQSTGETATNGLKSGKPLLAMLIAQVAMILGAILAPRLKGDNLSLALALKAPAGGVSTYARALGLMLAVVAIYTALAHFIVSHDPSSDLNEVAGLFRGPWWPVALLVIGVGAPLSEELLFRGYLQTALVPSSLGFWGASLVTTAIWTALHAGYSIVGLVEVFMIGMIFALMLRLTGSLRVTLACHAIYNTGIALLLIFAPKELLGF